MTTCLIVDDEPLARSHLRRLLEGQGVTVTGEAESAAKALQLSEELWPDVLMLDIRMPGISGMQMVAALVQLDSPPLIVLVTGYSEHAVAAFEHEVVDYLLKPVSAERLAKTLVRVRERLSAREIRGNRRAAAEEAIRSSEPGTLRRLPIREAYSVRLVRVEQIRCAVAKDKRVVVRTGSGEHRTYYTLGQLEKLLPSDMFLRIHESAIVNLDFVEELLFLGNHAYEVRLSGGDRIAVGRTRYADLQHRLGLVPEPAA